MYKLPELKYSYNDLEPFIDEQTMRIHHTKHHQAYLDNLNQALKPYPALLKKNVEELIGNLNKLPAEIRTTVQNNGGGHANHSFFWSILGPPKKSLLDSQFKKWLEKHYGSINAFKNKFKQTALKRFGSGWVWLVIKNQKPEILSTANQNSPLMNQAGIPILALDVWEHAYYLNYQNRRAEYVDAWWQVINWTAVEKSLK